LWLKVGVELRVINIGLVVKLGLKVGVELRVINIGLVVIIALISLVIIW